MKRIFSLALSLIMFASAVFGTFMSVYAGDKIFGVDISVHDGVVDFTDLQNSGKEFVMIRLGYSQTLDKKFWDNVKNACDNKMNYGVYHYSYATSIAKAKLEADFVIDTLEELEEKGYADYFTLPVAYDLEDSSVADCGKTQVTNQMTTFLDMIKDSGYVPMVYANRNWFLNYIDLDTVVSKQYKIWYAYWYSQEPDITSPDFPSSREIGTTGVKADMWQYIDGDNSRDGYDQNVIFDPDDLVRPLVCKGNNHTWDDGKVTKKATTSVNGTMTYTCTECRTTKTQAIEKIASSALNTTATYYTGTVKTPTVTVKDSKGKELINGTDYTVIQDSGRIEVGRYSVKVTYKGKYSGSQTLYFNIIPRNVDEVKNLLARADGFTVYWDIQETQTTGYQIQYSTNSSFTNPTTITMPKSIYSAKKITGLAKNKKYYVRIRTYKTTKFEGKDYNIYSYWCAAKNVSSITTTAKLNTTATYYNGSVKTPTVTVTDSKGNTLKKGTDYTVTMDPGRKLVGRYGVTITYKGSYKYNPEQTLYFNIIPRNVTGIKKLTAGEKCFTVSWDPQQTEVTGYEIQYSTSSDFKNATTVIMPKSSYSARRITDLLVNKKYYVKIRTYKTTTFNGKSYNVYSYWCTAKAVTTLPYSSDSYSLSNNVLTVNSIKMNEYKVGSKFTESNYATVNGKRVFTGSSGCYGYVCYIQHKLYGHCSHTASGRFYNLSGSTNVKSPSVDKLKNLINSAGVGAHIRTYANANGNSHSMVIVGISSTGFTVADANADGTNKVDVRTYTWNSFRSSKLGKLGIRYIEVHK